MASWNTMEHSLDLFLGAQGSLIFWTRTAPWPTNVNPTAVRCHLLQFCPSMPSFVFAFFFEGAVSRGYTASLAQIGEPACRLYWVKRANNGASAMEEANCAEDWGGPTILSPLSFSVILRSAYYWPFFPSKMPCPRLTVIKNGQDLIDQKQAPCFCLDSCLASVLQRFCLASLPRVICSNIRHLEVTRPVLSHIQLPSACYAGHLDVNRRRAMLCMTKYRGLGGGGGVKSQDIMK